MTKLVGRKKHRRNRTLVVRTGIKAGATKKKVAKKKKVA
jgi:hypothetical protein